MAMQSTPTEGTAYPELVLSRVIAAPRELVYRAWTDPGHLARWWGPHGFTAPRCEADPRPGGAIRIDMRAPDGNVQAMVGTFEELLPPERLVFTGGAADAEGRLIFNLRNTVTFTEEGGGTRLTLRAEVLWASPEAAQYLPGARVGWTQTLDRLAEQVGPLTADEREIVATRVYEAPRGLVFRMWTEPEHVARWWGPRGFTTTVQSMDVRPGGAWRFVMRGPDGTAFDNEMVYSEVEAPARLAYTHTVEPRFEHEVSFADLGDRTEVTVRMRFETAQLRDRVVRDFGAVEGLNQTLDHLGEALAA